VIAEAQEKDCDKKPDMIFVCSECMVRRAVLVYSRVSEGEAMIRMCLWRNGRPSANPLALIDASEFLAQRYRLVQTITPEPDGRQVMVYVRSQAEQVQKTNELVQTRAADHR